MFNDKLKFKGHFTIQQLDAEGNLLDEYVEDNQIMETARTSMAELLALLSGNTSINKITLGTLGHLDGDILTPKSATEGFVKERTRLFSESITVDDAESNIILMNDVVLYNGTEATGGTLGNYYQYTGNDLGSTATSAIDFGTDWTDLGTTAPYTYSVGFDVPGTPSGSLTNITEDDTGSLGTIAQNGSDVTYSFDVAIEAANNGGTSVYTEAGLFIGTNIFSMKTFSAKVKDNTVILRIIWKISF